MFGMDRSICFDSRAKKLKLYRKLGLMFCIIILTHVHLSFVQQLHLILDHYKPTRLQTKIIHDFKIKIEIIIKQHKVN